MGGLILSDVGASSSGHRSKATYSNQLFHECLDFPLPTSVNRSIVSELRCGKRMLFVGPPKPQGGGGSLPAVALPAQMTFVTTVESEDDEP